MSAAAAAEVTLLHYPKYEHYISGSAVIEAVGK